MFAGILVVAFLAATFALNHARSVWVDQYDDSYITYRYAVNLATGKGLVFNTYERVNSASSFLYTLMLAGAYRVGVHDLERFAAAFGLAMGCVLVVITFLMTRAATGREREAFLFTLPLCFAGPIGGWAASGMETIFFATLVAAFLHLYLFTAARRSLAFALLGLVVLCRVEGLVLLGVVGAREVLAPPHDQRRRHLALLASLAVAPLAALTAFDLAYYGSAIPHSVTLKRISIHYAPGLGAQVAALARFYLLPFGGYTVLAGVAMVGVASAIRRTGPRAQLSPLAVLTVYAALTFASVLVGPSADMERYSVHILPVLAVLALAGWLRIRPPRPRDLAPVVAALALAAGAFGNGLVTADELGRATELQRARRQIGMWLSKNTRPGDLIASADLGEIAYLARDRDFVDVFGLTSADFAELSQTAPDRMPVLFARRRPAYVADTAFRPPDAAAVDDGALLTATEVILAHPSIAFRGVTADPPAAASLPFRRRPVLSLHAGGSDFMIAAIDWP